MPTPSNNAPDPIRSPRSFSFSTCPEGDDNEQHILEQEEEPRPLSEHLSSLVMPAFQLRHGLPNTQLRAGWPPLSSSSYVDSSVDEEQSSRSATFSPVVSSVATATSTIAGSSQEPTDSRLSSEGVMTSDDDEDDQKEADMVDPMLGISSSSQSDNGVHANPSELEAHRIGQQTAREQLILSLAEAEGPERGGPAGLSNRSMNWRRPERPGRLTTTGEEGRLDYPPDDNSGSPPFGGESNQPEWVDDRDMLGSDYKYCRVIPVSPSPYLRSGSRFHGTQQSERQRYDVQVEIKHVDLRESYLCGYLRIQGLTEDHPTLTTYFEGEIIGTKYGFTTQHPSWGASDKTDMSHWGKFQAFRPIHKQMKKTGSRNVVIHDVANCENIFMRWKEHFLVPDHRVRTIHGASFEGFYYICFNQVRGEVSGIYFHSKSEKFQQLELKHVEDKGCHAAVEFR